MTYKLERKKRRSPIPFIPRLVFRTTGQLVKSGEKVYPLGFGADKNVIFKKANEDLARYKTLYKTRASFKLEQGITYSFPLSYDAWIIELLDEPIIKELGEYSL